MKEMKVKVKMRGRNGTHMICHFTLTLEQRKQSPRRLVSIFFRK